MQLSSETCATVSDDSGITQSPENLHLSLKVSARPASNRILQVQIPHFVRMVSLVMADQLRTVVLSSINAFAHLWDAFDLAADLHAASAGCPLEKQDGSTEVPSLPACWICKLLTALCDTSYIPVRSRSSHIILNGRPTPACFHNTHTRHHF